MTPEEILLSAYRGLTDSTDLLVAAQKDIIERHVKKIERLTADNNDLDEQVAYLTVQCAQLKKLLKDKL